MNNTIVLCSFLALALNGCGMFNKDNTRANPNKVVYSDEDDQDANQFKSSDDATPTEPVATVKECKTEEKVAELPKTDTKKKKGKKGDDKAAAAADEEAAELPKDVSDVDDEADASACDADEAVQDEEVKDQK